ncbi:MAG TPA: autotransporter-associated beta strand repeat-containing protein, partial [Gammaproteobacteria bacterium]|nr:autotransporter-associated beta strand repeat-containing protein [Gammaproteobacteria bacterium]
LLTVTQSVDGTYAGVISGSGGFTKAGTAILTLSGTNTYSGVTNINAGAIYATNNNSLGDTVGNTIIANNAALHVGGGITIAEALNITGTGLSSAGAIRSISGNNTLSGAITLAGSSRINSDANTLTLTGGITGIGQALTIGGSGNTTISTTGINTSTAGTLTKDGSGVLLLNATNNYTGATSINAGTLRLGASDRIADSSDLTLADVASAVFDLNGFNETIANLTGGGSTGGNITLGAGTLTATQSLDGTYAGVISGSGGFTKAGTAILTLSGTNTYSGVTNINAGAIYATNNNSLGDTVGNTIIANNAALHIAGGVTIAEALNITGTGLSSAGAVRSISGNNTLSGAITLAGSSRINSDANTLTLTGGIVGTGQALTIGGSGNTTISTTGINTSTAGTLTKDGSGVLLLNATNNYTGATTINAGTLRLGASDRIADSSDVVLADVASAVFDLNGFNETIANLTGGGTTGGNITLGAGTLIATQSLDGTYAGVISGSGGFTKAGSAVLTLSGANTYSGVTNISAGAIYATNNNSLGDTVGNTIIANNAALHIAGGVTIAEALNITGTGLSSAGAIRSISGNNTLSGAITLAGSSRINSDANTLTLTGGIVGTGQALTIGGSGNTTISTAGINTSTAGTLTKDGSGVLLLNATNNYTGATTINAGTLRLGASDRIANNSDVVLADVASAVFDLNGFNETIANLTGGGTTGGNITLGAGALLTVTQSVNGTYAGVISGSGGLTKAGSAVLTLSGANTYSGVTNISAGAIYATNNNSLGDTVGNTIIANNAALHIGGGVTIAEALNITGTGIFSTGALRNISGNNTLSGVITLAGSTRINSDANTLTLTGGIVGTGQALIIGGSGNTTISTTGINTSTSGALTKDGSGVLLLNVASNYTGLTTINGGTISIANASGLGDASGGTVVSSGATLDINNVNINNEELTLSGNGVSNNGALITTGTSSFSGNINILNNSTVNINNASELTLSGIVSGIGDLTKIGNGMLILSGSNTYTGKTYINAGTIDVKNADGLGSISEGTVVAANATLSVDNLALSSELLTLSGEGVGSLGALVGNGVTLIPGDIIINGNVGVGVPGSSVMTVSGNISGVGSITKIGTGTLILLGDDISVNTQNITGDNTFSMVPESVLDNVSNKVYIQVPIFSRDSDDALEINVNGFDLKKSLKDFMDKMELSIVER